MYTRIKSFNKKNVDYIENQVKKKGSFFVQFWGPKNTARFRNSLDKKGIVEDFCEGSCKNFVYVMYKEK